MMKHNHTKMERLAERYDSADTSRELVEATAATADPPAASERMTTFAVRLPVSVLDHVREVAAQRGMTTSAVIRQWIETGIAEDVRGADDRVVSVSALVELIGRTSRDVSTSPQPGPHALKGGD